MPRKSKAGLIVAMVAVLAVGGGVAAFVVASNKGNGPGSGAGGPGTGQGTGQGTGPGTGQGTGSSSGLGSQIASNGKGSDAGSGRVIAGTDGSAAVRDGSGSAAGSDAKGSNSASNLGSGHAGSDSGSGHAGSNVEINNGSDAGSNTPPPVEVVQVLLFARNGVAFEVFENGTKLFDGPDNLEVPKGEKRTVVIKARGFKDKTMVVEGKKKRVQFSLQRIAVPDGGGSAHVTAPPPGPNCTSAIVDPKSKACVAQYCAVHPEDEAKCGLE
jgi:hypothetical protein